MTTKTPNDTDVWVGARLRLRRVELGLSQTEIGDRLGVTFQQVQKYERGVNRIGASRLEALARALEVPVGYFFPGATADVTAAATNPAEVLDLLRIPGAVDLLRVFAGITNPGVRRAATNLLESLAATREQSVDILSAGFRRPN